MANGSVIDKAVRYLKLLRQNDIPVSQGVLYGSTARDDAHSGSDIDLLVISPLFDADPRAHVGAMWRLAAQIDSRIEPVPVGARQFEEDRVILLLEMARREGVVIP